MITTTNIHTRRLKRRNVIMSNVFKCFYKSHSPLHRVMFERQWEGPIFEQINVKHTRPWSVFKSPPEEISRMTATHNQCDQAADDDGVKHPVGRYDFTSLSTLLEREDWRPDLLARS